MRLSAGDNFVNPIRRLVSRGELMRSSVPEYQTQIRHIDHPVGCSYSVILFFLRGGSTNFFFLCTSALDWITFKQSQKFETFHSWKYFPKIVSHGVGSNYKPNKCTYWDHGWLTPLLLYRYRESNPVYL